MMLLTFWDSTFITWSHAVKQRLWARDLKDVPTSLPVYPFPHFEVVPEQKSIGDIKRNEPFY